MIEIIPAILPKNYEDLKNKLSLVRGHAPVAQIDICDGRFVQNITWPFDRDDLDDHFRAIINESEGLPFWEDVDFELDLMVEDAKENFDLYLSLGARRMVFHQDSFENTEELRDFIEGIDAFVKDAVEFGVAVTPDKDVKDVQNLVPAVNFLQVMGIEKVGFQGQEFDNRAIELVKNLREKYSELVISVDGGVSRGTAMLLRDAGVDRLVSGSAIFKSNDIMNAINNLRGE